MKARVTHIIECTVACMGLFLGLSQIGVAQEPANLPYTNPQLSPEQRATDLVRRMTLAEKATQMQNNSAAVPRLKIPAYQWWSEALHGVINEGVTEYPEPVGLAATFDAPGIHTMAAQIGIEGRIKHVQNAREGHTGIMGGLDFWSPNLNIFRDPRWGRGQETYGEDPFLTGRMGVAYVTGLQGDRSQILPRHRYAEALCGAQRTGADAPLRRCGRQQARPGGYVRARIPRCRRGRQGRFGHVRLQRHQWRAGMREPVPLAGSVAGQVGISRDMWFRTAMRSETLPPIIAIVRRRRRARRSLSFAAWTTSASPSLRGLATRSRRPISMPFSRDICRKATLDTALIRLFTARMKLGMFDPPEMVPYTKIDEKELDSAEHRAHARKLANESMVLLKNDGLLPLKPEIKKIAVVGPLADQTRPLIGNYAGQPTHIVSILDGLKAEFPNAAITFVPGTQFLRTDGTPVPDALLTTPDGKPGLKADYNEGMRRGHRGRPDTPPIVSRTEATSSSPRAISRKKWRGRKPLACNGPDS